MVSPSKLTLQVIDHGLGIPPSDQIHLFDRFFRASNVTNIQGVGLGMNIVKRYMEILQGEISFESTEGKGTTFTLLFSL
jgi:signal transduction histidine kinase